jgi:SNF2 family DNA or RNA helicase
MHSYFNDINEYDSAQQQLYRSFLSSDQVRSVLDTSHNVLSALVVLKKICDNPLLLSEKMKAFTSIDPTILASLYVNYQHVFC